MLRSPVTALRAGAAALLTSAAFLFPLSRAPSPMAYQQIWCGGLLVAASLLWGVARLPRGWTALAFALAALIAARASVYADTALFGVAFVGGVYVALHAGASMTDGRRRDIFVVILCAAAAVNAFEGLLQYFGLGWQLYPWVPESLERGVAFGALGQRNLFATFLVTGSVAAAWLVQAGRITPGMGWLVAGVLQAGIAASASRIGMAGGVAVALVALVAGGRLRPAARRLLVGQMVLYAAFVLLIPWLADLHGFEPPSIVRRLAGVSNDTRVVLWRNALDIIAARPLWGWGWHEFGFAHYDVPLAPRFGGEVQTLDNAHNLLLQLAAEFGWPAALVLLAASALLLLRALRRQPLSPERLLALTIVAVLLLHSAVEFPLWSAPLAFVFAVALGFLASEAPAFEIPAWEKLAVPAIGIGAIAFTIAAERQYEAVTRLYETPSRMRVAKQAAFDAAAGNWLFLGQIDFARLAQLQPGADNAPTVEALAQRVLHFSAEPVVVAKLVEAAWLAGDMPAFLYHRQRFVVAFPNFYARWSKNLEASQPSLASWLAAHPLAEDGR